jgi:hypothetical protein
MAATDTQPATYGGTISIPAGCKPSVCVSKERRPTIANAYLRRRDDGLWLLATDSYIAVALKVEGDAQDGHVPVGALRLMERGKHGEQLSATAWRVRSDEDAVTTFDIAGKVAGDNPYPNLDKVGLWGGDLPGVESVKFNGRVTVGMNAGFMKRIADAFGSGDTGCRFEMTGPLAAIRVAPLRTDIEAVAIQMPIRLNV